MFTRAVRVCVRMSGLWAGEWRMAVGCWQCEFVKVRQVKIFMFFVCGSYGRHLPRVEIEMELK